MTLPISQYTAVIIKQTLVTDARAKDTPYLYEFLREPDLTQMTLGELEVIERNCWEIADKVMKEMEKRNNELSTM